MEDSREKKVAGTFLKINWERGILLLFWFGQQRHGRQSRPGPVPDAVQHEGVLTGTSLELWRHLPSGRATLLAGEYRFGRPGK
jgi:hypothetical protein